MKWFTSSFLSAHWKHLVLANYAVAPEALSPYVPKGTEIDESSDNVYVSLVAFLFEKTKVIGLPAIGNRNFEEVNLRFYVTPKHDRSIRAVTFIKEIVPSRLIPLVANGLFDENYVCLPMAHDLDDQHVDYRWGKGDEYRVQIKLDQTPSIPESGSVEEFITEHYWGYAMGKRRTLEYEVRHPQWPCCRVNDYQIDVDFGKLYGDDFVFLNHQEPEHVFYAHGSHVTVSFPGTLQQPD